MLSRPIPLFAALTVALVAVACGADEPAGEAAYDNHGVSADFDAVPATGKDDAVSDTFDYNRVVSDAFFTDSEALSPDLIQAFLERTPYDNRSWLADETIAGAAVSETISAIAQRHGINPMMLLVRLQVEGSHISTSERPSDFSVDRALGCGCFDGEACRGQYLGLDKQIDCAADTYERRYAGSVDGSWEWRKGHTKRTLDGINVRPDNHATATLYAYTPWVLRGRGGNWLFWNVTKKYVYHLRDLGLDDFGQEAWIGTPCVSDADCNFVDGDESALCYDFAGSDGATYGFCTFVCEGYCPDRSGEAPTFCIASDVADVGVCAAKSHSLNEQCATIPGTVEREHDRFIGTSDAGPSTGTVCAP